MNRRDAVLALLALGTAPFAASAQQGDRVRRVGVLMGGLSVGDPGGQSEAAGLKQGFQELGWVEGRNLQFTYSGPSTWITRAS